MGTRQTRVSAPEDIRRESANYLNHKVNVVLKDNTVRFGKLCSIKNDVLVIENLRQRKTGIAIDQISELYLDSNL